MAGEWILFFRQSLASLMTCGMYTPGRWHAFAKVAGLSEQEVSVIIDALPELFPEQDDNGGGGIIEFPAFDFHARPVGELQADRKAYLVAMADLTQPPRELPVDTVDRLQRGLRGLLDGTAAGGPIEALQPQAAGAGAVGELQDAAGKMRRPKRRRKTDAAPRPMTAKQTEAVQIVGECKGNFSEAARRLGVSAKTVREHYQAGLRKLGRKAVKHATQQLPSDRRGQDAVTSDDDRRRG